MIALSTIISILAIFGTFFLVILVLSKKPIDDASKSFALIILGGAFWIFSVFVTDHVATYKDALWWARLAILGPIVIAPALLYFSLFFPKQFIKIVPWKRFSLFFPALILLLFVSTPFNVSKVAFEVWGTNFTPGPLYQVLIAYFLLYFIPSFYIFFQSFRRGNNLERAQIIYVGLGLFFAFLIGTITNLILPLFGEARSSVLGPAFAIVPFIIFTAYAVFKHHLLDVKVVAAEFLVFGLLIVLTIEMLLSTSLWSLVFRFVLLGAFGAMGYFLIRSVLNEVRQREELQRTYQKLKELDAAKSEFISIASHQLRAPLTAIKGYISMVLEGSYGNLNETQQKPIKGVYDSNERLIQLVNDLLNLSRIESGKITLELQQAKLEEIVHSVADELKLKAKGKKLKLIVNKSEPSLPSFQMDPVKIRNVFLNLIDNAIKYTSKGSITIAFTLNQKNKHAETNTIITTIKDTGEGMTQEEINHLFESFSRGGAGTRMATEGAGLGLYIAKQFVKLHKGQIWAESKGRGKGSTFFIELPIQ